MVSTVHKQIGESSQHSTKQVSDSSTTKNAKKKASRKENEVPRERSRGSNDAHESGLAAGKKRSDSKSSSTTTKHESPVPTGGIGSGLVVEKSSTSSFLSSLQILSTDVAAGAATCAGATYEMMG